MLSDDPFIQKSHGRSVAKCGVDSPPAIKRFDSVEQISLRCGRRNVAGAMHPLILQAVEEAVRRRVAPAFAFAAHRADHSLIVQPRLKGVADILVPQYAIMPFLDFFRA